MPLLSGDRPLNSILTHLTRLWSTQRVLEQRSARWLPTTRFAPALEILEDRTTPASVATTTFSPATGLLTITASDFTGAKTPPALADFDNKILILGGFPAAGNTTVLVDAIQLAGT